MGNIAARQASRSIYHDPSIRQALQQRRFATAGSWWAAHRSACGARTAQKKPQDSGRVHQLVASTGAVYRAPACDPWSRGQLFR